MAAGSVCKTVTVSSGRGRYRLQAEAKQTGRDVLVTVWGGTAPHIGSVAVAVPRPGLSNPEKTSATASVFNFIGHKDDAISVKFAERMAARFGCSAVTVAGVHLDGMNSPDLHKLMKNAETLLNRLIKRMEPYFE